MKTIGTSSKIYILLSIKALLKKFHDLNDQQLSVLIEFKKPPSQKSESALFVALGKMHYMTDAIFHEIY